MSDADPSRGSGDSLWSVKPWWCQPWSIVLSGVVVVVLSWLWLGRWWLTAPLGVAVSLWWWLFLVVVPTAYARQSQEIS
ncbi:DUF6737 family protein [Cyanobium sp. LEGE 06113]|uniref:DUF6737 family protein n=1 Tax=Cyanobium sp. LEGE 06113 TaxID=1297573 RepID=UPI00187DFB3E|nr:hypothetical protein [Cyanobium sp. LEGE 06113]